MAKIETWLLDRYPDGYGNGKLIKQDFQNMSEIKVGYADCDNIEECGLGHVDEDKANADFKFFEQVAKIKSLEAQLVTLQNTINSLQIVITSAQEARDGWKQAFNEMRTIAVDRLTLILEGQKLMRENLALKLIDDDDGNYYEQDEDSLELQKRIEQWLNQ